jgi:hypothetical protein
MHASISAHIAREYLLDERAGAWGPNLELFRARLGNEGVRERVENLYFAYLFVLRAALKAGPLLAEVAYDTGSPAEDARTAQLMRQLVRACRRPPACPPVACRVCGCAATLRDSEMLLAAPTCLPSCACCMRRCAATLRAQRLCTSAEGCRAQHESNGDVGGWLPACMQSCYACAGVSSEAH